MRVFKRFTALILTLVMILGMLPTIASAEEGIAPDTVVVTEQNEAILQADVLGDIQAYLQPKRDVTQDEEYFYTTASDAIKEIVLASDTYVEGSLIERGDAFYWQTTTGITCGYNPQHEYEISKMEAPIATRNASASACTTFSYANADSNDVCLVAPMYAEDSSFTEQYGNETRDIAAAKGGTAYKLLNSGATVTAIAQALEKCGVVIFDSHGNTDWGYFDGGSDGTGEADCTSEANTSYLCLSSGTGMTTADMAYQNGTYGTYPHAYSDTSGNYVADGTAFANHMSTNAPNSILWMAICLGMATNGICAPMRNKGVDVVYGYSQSVSFTGDYSYETRFWDRMIAGDTVAEAITSMKTLGMWDPAYSTYTLTQARSNYCAFPIVASTTDTYPGQGNVDAYQTVTSTKTLVQYNVTATSNNNNYGTVSVSGSTITAVPATGYLASGYSVISGTATVTQSGNTFTVDASSDCTIQITFTAQETATVTFLVDGATFTTQTGYTGASITLPAYTGTAPTGYTFLGWTDGTISETTNQPVYYAAGASYTIPVPSKATSLNLYALFSREETSGSGGGSGDYEKVTTAPSDWSGDYLIVYEAESMILDSSRTTLDAVNNYKTVTISSQKIAATEGDPYKVTIAASGSSYTIKTVSGYYIGATGNSNSLNSSTSTAYTNTIALNGNNVNIIGSGGAYLRFNTNSGQDRFRYFKSSSYSSQQPISLYKAGAAGGGTTTTYYTTDPVNCDHASTTNVAAVAATCSAVGYTAGVYCNDCETYISGHEVIEMSAHTYGAAVSNNNGLTHTATCTVCGDAVTTACTWGTGVQTTAPTATQTGVMTYTCTVCGGTKTEIIAALGEDFTVSFYDYANDDVSEQTVHDSDTATAPTAPTAPAGYAFIGWSETDLSTATDTAPTLYNFSLPVTADLDLFAIYAIAGTSSGGSDTYELVTEDSQLVIGSNVVIAASGYNYAISTTQNPNNRGQAAITKNGNTITLTSDVDELTLGAGTTDGTYSFFSTGSNGYLCAASSGSNYLRTEDTLSANSSWAITPSTTTTSVIAQGSYTRATMQYNNTSSIFSCYSSASMKAVALYIKTTGASVAYTGYTSIPTIPEQMYSVAVTQATGGAISASLGSAAADTVITLIAIPDSGYAFGSWTVTDADSNPITVTNNTFSMPAADVTVTATFTQVPTYTLTYDSNTDDIVIGMPSSVSGITEGTSYTLSTAEPVRTGYFFMGWAATAASEDAITSVTMNEDTTVYAIWLAKEQYTASFYNTESAAPTTTILYEDETLTAPANPTVPTGFVFCGWTTAPYTDTTAPTYYTFGSALTANTNFYAVYTLAGAGGDTYTLVRSNDDLSAGDKYILVGGPYNTNYFAASTTLTSGYIGKIDIDAPVNSTVTNSDSGLCVFTLGGTADAWTLTNANGNVLSATSATALSNDGTYTAWTISVTDGAATITNNQYPTGKILYNASSPRFKNYTSTPSASMQLPALYKQASSGAADAEFTTDPTVYTATWMNGEAVYQSDMLLPDAAIVAPTTDPTKTGIDTEYYTFAGWSLAQNGTLITDFGTISDNMTYYAVYTTTVYCVINWMNGTTTLETDYCNIGDTPVYDGAEPTKDPTSDYYYVFTGWAPEISAVTGDINYVAQFREEDRYEASLELSRTTVKVGRTVTATPILMDCGVATAGTPVYSFNPTGIATVDAATGVITGVAVGSTEVTVTYTVGGVNYTASQNLVVTENTSAGGYTLITQDNAPADWSGDYIIMGKTGGTTTYQNTWMILTPNFDINTGNTGVGIATNNEDAATVSLTDDNGVGTGTINDEGNASAENSNISRGIEMEDTGLVTDVNGNDIAVYDTITSIDSAYAFTIECIDDVNQIYTIRVKDTSLYIACSSVTTTGSNSLNFSAEATEFAQWQFSVQRVTKGGYNNDIITAQNVGNETRRLYFNNNQEGATNGQFRDYNTGAFSSAIGGNTTGGGPCYSLYLFGNPNPFNAQIYHQGEQITITNDAEIPQGRTTPVELTSALVPDIANYPNWEISTPATWSLDFASTSEFIIDAGTGELSIRNAVEGDYTLVKVDYVVHDLLNNVYHNVSTLAKITVIAGTATYSTVIYETASGNDTETQYTVYKTTNGTNTLPLSAYVVNDLSGATSRDEQNPVTMGGTLVWTLSQTGSGATINQNTGAVDFSGVTADNILTVTATGATGNGTAATAATYKIYVKTISYTAEITHTNGVIGAATIPYGTSAALGNIVTDANDATVSNGETGTVYTVSYTNAIWAIVGTANGATIIKNANGAATLNVSNCEAGTVITVRLAGMTATTIPGAGETAITTTIPATTQVFTVGQRPTSSSAVADVVVVDYALPMQMYVLDNDTYENLTVASMDLISAPATFTIAQNDVTGNAHYGDLYIQYTPSGELYTSVTFQYQVTLSDNSTQTADVTVKPAGSVYYEQNYSEDAQGENGYFTYQDGKHGIWETVGTQSVFTQSDSLSSTDVFEYDSNYSSCATYSGGSSKMTTVGGAIVDDSKTLSFPQVDFSFVGTGFDMMSVTSNNTGAFIISVNDTESNTRVYYKIINTYYGYNYSEEAVEQTVYTHYDRYSKTIVDGVATYTKYVSGDLTGFDYIASQSVNPNYYYVAQFYTKDGEPDDEGFYVASTISTHWLPSTVDNALYQIPVVVIDDLPYGRYNVTVTPTYTPIFDVDKTEENYDFYFDAVRIHNPINEVQQFNYISIRDRLIDGSALGNGSATPCPHTTVLDWAVTTAASNTNNGKGSMERKCAACGYTMDKAYYYVTATAAPATLDTGSGLTDPETAALTYNVTWDSALDAVLTGAVFTPSWRSGSANVITCTTATATATAQGPGSTYANLQLKIGDVTYASAIHTNNVTVTGSFIGSCAHSWVQGAVTPATCTEPAYNNYTCSLCGTTMQEPVDGSTPLGHDCIYTNNGDNHTVTCSRCDYSVTEAHTYTNGFCICGAEQPVNTYSVSYVVPEGATAPSTQTVTEGNTITVASAVEAPAAYTAHTYTFVGWAASTVAATETQPTLISAEATYMPTSNTTLYAVYNYSVTGGGAAWTLVDDLSTITEGTYAFLTTDYHAFNGSITSGHGQVTTDAFSFTNGVAAVAPDGTMELTLAASGTGFTVYNADNGYLYATDAKSGSLSWQTAQSSEWRYNGENWIYTTNSARLRSYNNASLRTYGSNTGDVLVMAKKGTGSSTYYTTTLEAVCEHINTTSATVPATCTTDGSTTVTCDDCGAIVSTTVIAALGHDYESVTTAATCVTAGSIVYTCSRCGDSYTETIPATGHTLVYTDNGDGTHDATCSVCHLLVKDDEAHNYVNGTCSYCGALQPDNYAASINPHGTTADPYQIVVDSMPEIDLGLTNNGNAVSDYTVTFTSSDSNIAEADESNGAYNIYAYAIGTATITAHFTVNSVEVATATTYVQVVAAVWTATFVVPAGVTAPAEQRGTSATMPDLTGTPSDTEHDYTFVGWVDDDTISNTTDEPSSLAVDDTVALTADKTYYALYTYTQTTGGSGDFSLITTAGDIDSGNYVLIVQVKATDTYKGNYTYYALQRASDGSSYVAAAAADTYMGSSVPSSISVTDDTIIWIGTGSSTGFTLADDSNVINNSSNNLYYRSGTATSWTATAATNANTFTLANSGRYIGLRSDIALSTTTGNPKFRCNSSASSSSYMFYLYKQGSGGAATSTDYWTILAPAVTVNYTASIAGNSTIAVGSNANLTAILYADGEATSSYTSVAWTTSDSTKISLGSTNSATTTATAEAAGDATITATFTVDGQTVTATKVVTAGTSTGPTTAQDVDYLITSGKVANWGKRGNTALFLTTYAQSYYTGSYTYATLAANAGASATGASTATTLYNSDLAQALHSMVAAKQTSTTSYDGTKALYPLTDCEENDTEHMSSYYSGTQLSSEWDSGATWNREHTWPNSKGLGSSDENDIMMLRPTATNENGSRGNTAYGAGSSYYDPNDVSNNTLNLHGDVARLVLQHFVRWGNTSYLWGASGVFENRAVMLQWLAEDPVDTWEMGRNDAVQSMTGVRNVFVDYPELAFQLLGADVPAGYISPSCPSGVRSAAISRSATLNDEPATKEGEIDNFVGAVFIDGKGSIGEDSLEDLAKNGPKNEIYLNAGQCIVFYLTGIDASKTTKDLQIGAKAVNGSAGLQVIALTGTGVSGNTNCLTKTIATATEMYYEFGGGVTWSNGMSCAIVIRNSGSGILSLTKLRYSNTEDLSFYVNSDVVTRANRVLAAINNGENVFAEEGSEHAHTVVEDAAVAATCTTTGLTAGSHCSVCDEIIVAQETADALGHDFIYTNNGEDHTVTCSRCDYNVTEAHSYTDGVCVCGAEEVTGPTYDATLNITKNSFTLGASLNMAYVFTKAGADKYADAYVVIEKDVADGTPIEKTYQKAEFASVFTNYRVNFEDIAAKELGDNFRATVYATDANGKLYRGNTLEISLKDYIMNMLNTASTAAQIKSKPVCVELLNYGAAAQIYFNYDVNNLANADLSAEQIALGSQSAPSAADSQSVGANTGYTCTYTSCSPVLGSKVTLAITYGIGNCLNAYEGYDVVVKNAETGVELDRSKLERVGVMPSAKATFNNLDAAKMRTLVTIAIYDGETQVSPTLTWSIESYVAQKAAGTDAKLAAVCNALLNYGDAAANVDNYEKTATQGALEKGIIKGENNALRPTTAARTEIATISERSEKTLAK